MADITSTRLLTFPLRLAFLVESILNEMPPSSPREATLARIAAGRARDDGNADEMARQLDIARQSIEAEYRVDWRDALRANSELALHLVALGRFDEALPVLERAFKLLDSRFGSSNLGAAELHYLIGYCHYLQNNFETYSEHFAKSSAIMAHFDQRAQQASLESLQMLCAAAIQAARDNCCGCGGCFAGK